MHSTVHSTYADAGATQMLSEAERIISGDVFLCVII